MKHGKTQLSSYSLAAIGIQTEPLSTYRCTCLQWTAVPTFYSFIFWYIKNLYKTEPWKQVLSNFTVEIEFGKPTNVWLFVDKCSNATKETCTISVFFIRKWLQQRFHPEMAIRSLPKSHITKQQSTMVE